MNPPALSPEALFEQALRRFNDGRFYECHELLEEIWTSSRDPERRYLQSLIHFAVGFYHHQRRNQTGAVRQLRKGLDKIGAFLPEWGGVATAGIARDVRSALEVIEEGGTITTFPHIARVGPFRPDPAFRTAEGGGPEPAA